MRRGVKVNSQITIQHEAIGSIKHFHSPCEKCSDNGDSSF